LNLMGVGSAGEEASPAVQRQGLGYIKGKNMGFPFKTRERPGAFYAPVSEWFISSHPDKTKGKPRGLTFVLSPFYVLRLTLLYLSFS